MRYLIQIEFRKIVKTTYFLGSFLAVLMSPIVALLLMTINPTGMVIGDFNKINIFLLATVGSKTLFPMIAMSLLQVGHGMASIKSAFLTPVSRTKVVLSKVLMSFIWMIVLIAASILMIAILEIFLFRDMTIVRAIFSTIPVYLKIALYAFPIQIIAMILTLLVRNMLVPALFFATTVVSDYMVQLTMKYSFLPSAIPVWLSGVSRDYPNLQAAFIIQGTLGVLALIVLHYMMVHRSYVD